MFLEAFGQITGSISRIEKLRYAEKKADELAEKAANKEQERKDRRDRLDAMAAERLVIARQNADTSAKRAEENAANKARDLELKEERLKQNARALEIKSNANSQLANYREKMATIAQQNADTKRMSEERKGAK